MSDRPHEPNEQDPGELTGEPATEQTPAGEQGHVTEQAPVTEQASPVGAQAQAAADAAVPPRLMRRREGKLIAGVCTGLGAYTGTDPVLWRIGFVVLGLTTGIGIVGYFVAWLVMPQARDDEPLPTYHGSLNFGRWVGIGAIVLGALVLSRNILGIHGGVFWGLLLVGIGLAVWGRDLTGGPRPARRATPPPPPRPDVPTVPFAAPPPPASPPAASGVHAPIMRPLDPSHRPADRGPLVHEARGPSILGRIVVGASALAIGIALLLSNLKLVSVSPRAMLAVLLTLVGAGLLVGTWWGRARWLIFPGLAVASCLAVVAVIPFNARGGFGEANYVPTSPGEVRRVYEHTAGPLLVDLSHVRFTRPRTIEIREGFGPVDVILPPDVDVLVDGRVQGGPMDLFGHESEGWNVSDTVFSRGTGRRSSSRSLPRLRINVRVAFGPLDVDRVGASHVHGVDGRTGG